MSVQYKNPFLRSLMQTANTAQGGRAHVAAYL